jgi:sulfoxide reductase heme-binding subunit YedZ
MSHGFVPVQWNNNKKVYDKALWLSILLYIVVFAMISVVIHKGDEALVPMTILIRGFGSLGFILLTLILCVGPLARIDSRFLPLLYNRRHMGVSMFIIVLVHAILVIVWYHAFGPLNPIESIFTSPGSFENSADVAFQPLGFFALIILFIMAATSHDYWNTNLGAPIWKAIHMMVYVAFALVIAHVSYGAMQDSTVGLLPALVFSSAGIVALLHLTAALFFARTDVKASATNWIDIGDWKAIGNNRAKTIQIGSGERVAIFRYDNNKLAAISNVCQHQNGPLGEGCIIDGLITCPWHGYQYRPEDGRSPAPFTERVATYELKMDLDKVMLNTQGLPEGTERPVLVIEQLINVETLTDA